MANKRNPVWQNVDLVKAAWVDAESMTDIITKLGQPQGSASFLNVKKFAYAHNLVIPVSKSQTNAAINKNTIPLDKILVEHSTYTNRQALKRKLIKFGLKDDVCEICNGGPFWQSKTLVLQLDHINGVGDDNRIKNLRILCPNCHSQTDTFGYKGRGKNQV